MKNVSAISCKQNLIKYEIIKKKTIEVCIFSGDNSLRQKFDSFIWSF
jgi:hypothetical protein